MKHTVTRELYDYWNRLRAGRAAPERADIDPVMIRGILSDTFIIETADAGDGSLFPIRLSGTRLNAFLLTELKGWSMLTLFAPADRAGLQRIIRSVLDDGNPAVVGLKAAPIGDRPISLEMLLLPLRHHGKTHARLLGAVAPFDMPSWLGLLPIEHFALGSLRFIDQPRTAIEPGASRAMMSQISKPPKRYGPLLVHDGGRLAH